MVNLSAQMSTYARNLPTGVKMSEYPLTKIDLTKIDGIQRDIPLFKGVRIEDIAFITKRLETLNLFRGCKCGCSHCLKDAIAPKFGRESILFEDLKRFVSGFKKLSERMGFDVLNGNKYINIIDDSNPIDIPVRGLKKTHGVDEAMKLIYDTLRIPTLFVTSGLPTERTQNIRYANKMAANIVDMVKKNPDSVEEVQISINPFLKKEDYSFRMARTLFAFLDLFNMGKARIIYRHAQDGYKGYDAKAAKDIYTEIYNLLKLHSHSKLEGIPQLKPEVVTEFDKSHLIEPSGRGRRFFSKEQNYKLQQELIQDSLDWADMSKEEQREVLLNNSLKCVDIDGRIYTTKPSNAESVNTPIEITIPTDIKLNYINKEKPNKIFSDVEV